VNFELMSKQDGVMGEFCTLIREEEYHLLGCDAVQSVELQPQILFGRFPVRTLVGSLLSGKNLKSLKELIQYNN
jgi:hypothetical protein